MHWLVDMSQCGKFRRCGRSGWRQFGFAGRCKVVLNSTIRASLSPCRTLKLVPDMNKTKLSLQATTPRGIIKPFQKDRFKVA